MTVNCLKHRIITVRMFVLLYRFSKHSYFFCYIQRCRINRPYRKFPLFAVNRGSDFYPSLSELHTSDIYIILKLNN
jgi:hypothetical protein